MGTTKLLCSGDQGSSKTVDAVEHANPCQKSLTSQQQEEEVHTPVVQVVLHAGIGSSVGCQCSSLAVSSNVSLVIYTMPLGAQIGQMCLPEATHALHLRRPLSCSGTNARSSALPLPQCLSPAASSALATRQQQACWHDTLYYYIGNQKSKTGGSQHTICGSSIKNRQRTSGRRRTRARRTGRLDKPELQQL